MVATPSVAQTTLTRLTHAVALALRDQGLRERIRNDMRASRHTREHKLDFSDYLHGNGGILLAKMAQATGETHAQMLALLQAVPPLEFYMPVAAHRATWTGSDNLIVASQLVEGEAPVGFRTDGSPVTLTAAAPPATPVLVIVPAETDFSQELPANEWENGDDENGQAIGTLVQAGSQEEPSGSTVSSKGFPSASFVRAGTAMVVAAPLGETCDTTVIQVNPCDDGSDDGIQGAPAVYPTGVYVYQAHLNNLGEDWPRGAPEIELFVIAPTVNPSANGEQIACAGEHAASVKHYDQNTSDFQQNGWVVESQILSMAEINQYNQVYNAQYTLQLWEDDNEGCHIVFGNRSQLQELLDDLAAAGRATSTLITDLQWEH